MLKAIAFTMMVPAALVAVMCAAISFRVMPSGLYQSGNWLFETGIISDDGLILECPFINGGPFFFHYCRAHIPSIDV